MAESKPNQIVAALSGIRTGDVARYVFLPGVVPRVRRFIDEGTGSLAMLMALVFAAVRLLPPGHPYLNPVNRGRFGLRHVFGEAWSRLTFTRENIDQVVIFFALVGGFALLALQFVYMLFSLLTPAAHAAPLPFAGMFVTPNPTNDVALMLLDSVFGVPGMYDSCVSVAPGCGAGYATFVPVPTPFQQGLQALFQYYSLAMLVVAVLVILYYLLIVVGETAVTGTPFGRRFDHIWAPLRLVMAIGLLVPLNYGYNSGQYIVLITARLASGFATNAWIGFNNSMLSPLGQPTITPTEPTLATADYQNGDPVYPAIPGSASGKYGLVARPPMPDVTPVLEFMTLVEACKVAYEDLYPGTTAVGPNQPDSPKSIKPYIVRADQPATELTAGYSYSSALSYYKNSDVVIVFGDLNTTAYPGQISHVMPYCGEITVPTQTADPALTGVKYMSKSYFDWILGMFYRTEYYNFGILEGCLWLQPQPEAAAGGDCDAAYAYFNAEGFYTLDGKAHDPTDAWKQTWAVNENLTMIGYANTAYTNMLGDINPAIQTAMLNRGWGGAGLWYNQLSQWNGAFMGAVKGLPKVSKMPQVMEQVSQQKSAHDQDVDPDTQYDLNQSDKEGMTWQPDQKAGDIARELASVYRYWSLPKSTTPPSQQTNGNVIIDLIHLLFGPSLYSITQNDYVNPLVTLVALGNSILDTAMRNLLISVGSGAASGIAGVFENAQLQGLSKVLGSISGFFMMLVTVSIGIGVTLYYVLPFMPFLYFFFAVGAWVRSIFEAMVGVPLWALAHLKINGQGLPTESAIAGYFMILEIFVRPILTVFGLLASVTIFAALARTLNNLFPLVTSNLTGFDCAHCDSGGVPGVIADVKRDSLDQFFFTILYTITIYMMGTSSFKLIDQVPDGVLRWMGNNVQSFAQMGREDVGAHLGAKATEAVSIVQQQVAPGLQQTSQGVGSFLGQAIFKTGGNTVKLTGTPPPTPPPASAP